MSRIDPNAQTLDHCLNQISAGSIRIPRFQRDFVWNQGKSADLIDSIVKGYPVGSVILWRTSEELRDVRGIGRLAFPDPPADEKVDYILDGQQRLTSLYAALNGVVATLDDGSTRDFSSLVVDLSPPDEEAPICLERIPDGPEDGRYIALSQLYSEKFGEILRRYPDHVDAIERLRGRIAGYPIPTVKLIDASIVEATDVFSRLNTGGEPLTTFEIMVAKSYAPDRDFDLLDRWKAFRERLKKADYDTLEPITMLQLAALIAGGDARRSAILKLSKDDFIDAWEHAEAAMDGAVGWFRNTLRLPVSNLLPYRTLAVPVALFYHFKPKGKPNARQSALLHEFFWRVALTGYYSNAVETKLNADLARIRKIVDEERLRYEAPLSDAEDALDPSDMTEKEFRAGNSFSKAVLCALAHMRPRSFDTGGDVALDNAWMRRGDSKNFHHVFPRAWLRKKGYDDWQGNSVVNISLVDDILNKRKIRDRPPSDYFTQYAEENPRFESTMKTHLIAAGEGAAIWSDDYDRFLLTRAKAIKRRIEGWLQP